MHGRKYTYIMFVWILLNLQWKLEKAWKDENVFLQEKYFATVKVYRKNIEIEYNVTAF